jgi:hypothetical protein
MNMVCVVKENKVSVTLVFQGKDEPVREKGESVREFEKHTGWTVAGSSGARAWHRLSCGTWDPGALMLRERPKREVPVRVRVPMRNAGADRLVVVSKPGNAGGAKGPNRPASGMDQPAGEECLPEAKPYQRLAGKSRMSREAQVRFREGARVNPLAPLDNLAPCVLLDIHLESPSQLLTVIVCSVPLSPVAQFSSAANR